MERQVFSLALDQDLFRRLGPYRDVFLDHAVADEEVGNDGPVVPFGTTATLADFLAREQ